MVRTVVYLLISIFLITLIRAFIGLIGKAFGQLFQPQRSASPGGSEPAQGGELKQCATCGIYIAKTSALTRDLGGRELFFCSSACRDKHRNMGE